MKILFFGTGFYVIPILETLISDFEVPLVLTTEKSDSEPVSKFCRENNIECLRVSKFTDSVEGQLSMVNASLAVLANFSLIIPERILKIFPKGIINIHPSLLPKYRGPAPGQTAILNGDKKTGVTIIKLDEQVDHGPILAQLEEPILDRDTAQTLYERLFKIGSHLLSKSLPKYLSGELKPVEQNHSKATFTKTLTRQDGFIDLNSQSSIVNGQLSRMIRAYFPWPGVWTKTTINNKQSIIKFLPEKRIQVEGKKPMTFKDFLNGYAKLQPQLVELLEKL